VYRICFLISVGFLVGCSQIPPAAPYEEPEQSELTANIRLITNSNIYGDPSPSGCAPKIPHLMASAGRTYGDGKPNINYPPFPTAPKNLSMSFRAAPPMLKIQPGSRTGEGVITEVEARYRVIASVPFRLATSGTYGCKAEAKIVNLKAGSDYEVVVGVNRERVGGRDTVDCVFHINEITNFKTLHMSLTKTVTSTPAEVATCRE
jgi:hypothetical protein